MSIDYPANIRAQEKKISISPAYVYVFLHDGAPVAHLTSYDYQITLTDMPVEWGSDPQLFSPTQMGHDAPEQGLDINGPECNIAIAINAAAFASTQLQNYFLTAQTKQIDVIIARLNSSLLNGMTTLSWEDDTRIVFRGVTDIVTFSDEYGMSLHCLSLLLQEGRRIPRIHYQKTCQHALYGAFCNQDGNTNKDDHKTVTTVAVANRINRFIEIAETAANSYFFDGGFLIEVASGSKVHIARTELIEGGGTRLYLFWWPMEMKTGASINAFRGCRRNMSACKEFNNLANFMGTPNIPVNNPSIDGVA